VDHRADAAVGSGLLDRDRGEVGEQADGLHVVDAERLGPLFVEKFQDADHLVVERQRHAQDVPRREADGGGDVVGVAVVLVGVGDRHRLPGERDEAGHPVPERDAHPGGCCAVVADRLFEDEFVPVRVNQAQQGRPGVDDVGGGGHDQLE
jgi:hypothetical protein